MRARSHILLLGIALLWLAWPDAKIFANQQTPLSSIGETESFKDDKEAHNYVLSYRLTLRPYFNSPIAVKLYVKFSPQVHSGDKDIAEGLLIVKAIKDGTKDTVQILKRTLGDKEVRELLDTIREQEIFNLKDQGSNPEGDDIGLDGDTRVFERVWQDDWWNPHASREYHHVSVARGVTKSGPAAVVWDAFKKYAIEMMVKAQKDDTEKSKAKP